MRDLAGSIHEQQFAQMAEGCVKTRSDLLRYRHVIDQTKPKVIVETGTFSGKSACWFAQVAGAHVVTVDVHDQVDPPTLKLMADLGDVTRIVGSSIDDDVVQEVFDVSGHYARDEPVMVVLDSWHGRDHVLQELLRYAPLVTPGCYLVVEDTLAHWCPWELQPEGPYDGSPWEAVQHFLRGAGEGHFYPDMEVEDMLDTTQFPDGWLRRV